MKLTIELVPSTCFYTNVRSNVSKAKWDYLRRKCYRLANYKCEICAGVGSKHPVECHEIWHYDDEKFIQKLMGLIALCPSCHEVKHIGLSQLRGLEKRAIKQLMKVNETSEKSAKQYISESFAVWHKRSKHKWTLDISFLDTY